MNVSSRVYRAIREEIAGLEVQVAQRHRLRCPLDIDRQILDWEAFANEVMTGYQSTVYEYCRSLVLRDYIDEVIDSASEPTGKFVLRQLTTADETFGAATLPDREGWDLSEYFKVQTGSRWLRGPVLLGRLASSFPNAPPSLPATGPG